MIELKIIHFVILSLCHICHFVTCIYIIAFQYLNYVFYYVCHFFLNVALIYCPILHAEFCFYIDIQYIGYRGVL